MFVGCILLNGFFFLKKKKNAKKQKRRKVSTTVILQFNFRQAFSALFIVATTVASLANGWHYPREP